MAKYAYNVNKDNKIIEIQKQFPGGLKTVDTDDALGKVYLREAENVSLSEFSFLEKRYGTYIKEEFNFEPGDEPNFNNPIQGYFEFTKPDGEVDKLLFIGGNAFVKTSDSEVFVRKTVYQTEEGFTYPNESVYATVIGIELISNETSVSTNVLLTLLGNLSSSDNRFETYLTNALLSLTGTIEGVAFSDFDNTLSSDVLLTLSGNIEATVGSSGPISKTLTMTTVLTSTTQGEAQPVTVRIKSQTPTATTGGEVQWSIQLGSYSQSSNVDVVLNSTSFTTLRTDAPTGATVSLNITDNFTFNGQTYNLTGITSTSGTIQDFGLGQYDIVNITANTDITAIYDLAI